MRVQAVNQKSLREQVAFPRQEILAEAEEAGEARQEQVKLILSQTPAEMLATHARTRTRSGSQGLSSSFLTGSLLASKNQLAAASLDLKETPTGNLEAAGQALLGIKKLF